MKLASLHTTYGVTSVFHDTIYRELEKLNPRWNDERLFQESRRILNAEYQHILYTEFLPRLIGTQVLLGLV